MKHQYTLKSLIMSTGIMRFIFALNTILIGFLGLFVERSLAYSTFHSNRNHVFTADETLLYIIMFSSAILILDSCLAVYHIYHRSHLIKRLCNMFVRIRYIFWIPSILVFVAIAYHVSIDTIENPQLYGKYEPAIVVGYYLSYVVFGLLCSLNEAFIANDMVKSKKENEK